MPPKNNTHSTRSIYAAYVQQTLKANPTYWSLYHRPHRAHVVYRQKPKMVYGKQIHKVEEVISYPRFKAIMVAWLRIAQDKIVEGEALRLPRLGVIQAARVERNYRKKMVNWNETVKLRNATGKPKCEEMVYFDSPDWCSIRWDKPYGNVPWIEVYKFTPCDSMSGKGGFKDKFRNAVASNRALQLSYPFIPYIR